MQSIIQVLKLNEPKAWSMEGRSGFSHSAECLLLTADGQVDQVGVLRIKGEELIKKAQVGIYVGSFAMRSNPASRQIEAVLTDLQPVQKSGAGFVPVDAAAVASKQVKG
jgi:hypothetical protein